MGKDNRRRRLIRAVDLFAGGGGSSTGLALACRDLGARVDLVAVNHWREALETHARNHPWARHICASAETLDPRQVVPGGRLDLLVASPECVFFSTARGGRPVQDQRRASAWQVLRWLELLRVDALLVENVPEFARWGPLGRNGKPLKKRAGETFNAWLSAIRSLGYNVDKPRVVTSADYGDPTSRRRLFVAARRGTAPVRWPEPTHSKGGKAPGTRRWRAAREIIDWSLPSQSIFSRKKPLAPATMRRIHQGLERFGGPELKPFLVILRGTSTGRSVEDPVPALTAGGNHVGLAEPFMVHLTHGGRVHSVDDPIPTVTAAHRGELGVVEPFILSQASGGAPRGVREPVPTIPAGGAHALVEAFILPPEGIHRGNAPRSTKEPLQTITRRGGGYLVQPFIVQTGQTGGNGAYVRSVGDPLPTITTNPQIGVVEPCLVQYNGQSGAHSIDEPVPTLTTRDRLGLVQPVVNGHALDVWFRMLQPHELARATGFSDAYKFGGTKTEVVRMIGNAVTVQTARALCRSLLNG